MAYDQRMVLVVVSTLAYRDVSCKCLRVELIKHHVVGHDTAPFMTHPQFFVVSQAYFGHWTICLSTLQHLANHEVKDCRFNLALIR